MTIAMITANMQTLHTIWSVYTSTFQTIQIHEVIHYLESRVDMTYFRVLLTVYNNIIRHVIIPTGKFGSLSACRITLCACFP